LEGDYADGVMHGHGLYTYADGSSYDGAYEYGKMSGTGELTAIGVNVPVLGSKRV
jgi:hypothetical protein